MTRNAPFHNSSAYSFGTRMCSGACHMREGFDYVDIIVDSIAYIFFKHKMCSLFVFRVHFYLFLPNNSVGD